jgi:hypothetical protein
VILLALFVTHLQELVLYFKNMNFLNVGRSYAAIFMCGLHQHRKPLNSFMSNQNPHRKILEVGQGQAIMNLIRFEFIDFIRRQELIF